MKTRLFFCARGKRIYIFALPIIIAILSWMELEISSGYDKTFQFLYMPIKYISLNILTCGVGIGILVIIFNRIWTASIIFGIVSFLIALVNYYVVKFHGMPLTIADIKNFTTTLDVVGAYDIGVDKNTFCIIIFGGIALSLCLIGKRIEKRKSYSKCHIILRDILICLIGGSCIYIGYMAPNSIKPRNTIGFSWIEAYHTYGYVACSIENTVQSINVINMPEGYTEDKVEKIQINKEKNRQEKPDIILILNESFYDLKQISDIKTDKPYMQNIEQLSNSIQGYAVVPGIGGSTNSSEYELLTSNSLQLMPGITPFNVLDMEGANSIVSHLKQLGYYTVGAHSEKPSNYSRGRAYPDMGFDDVYFDDAFQKEYYADRGFPTDESLYRSLVSWYNEMPQENPRFMYLLTIQNHGGWDLNPSEKDIVHAENNYGQYQEQVNEYLTCIYMSDQAFMNLLEYFQTVDRPVVVCMVGDHSPSFAEKIVDEEYTENEASKRLRSTPFVIWANYEIKNENLGYISMNYLIPTLLDKMNIEVSPYYQYMLNLKKEIPMITSYGAYWDNLNDMHFYKDSTKYTDMVNDYFYLEYNNLQKNKYQEKFSPYS